MISLAQPGKQFALEVTRSTVMATLALSALIWLLLATQALLQAPVTPGPALLVALMAGLLPAVVAMSLPLGLLFACTAVAWQWADEGQLMALFISGRGGRSLVPSLLIVALMFGGLQATLTHLLEPMGRRQVTKTLGMAAGDFRLEADQPVMLGSVLVHADEVDGSTAQNLVLAQEQLVAVAEHGDLRTPGQIYLESGTILSVPTQAESAEWTIEFDSARIPIQTPAIRLDPPTLSATELQNRIAEMKQAGKTPGVEETTWYKRTTLPLAVPVLALLGLSLGARRVRPAVSALSVGLGWWAIMRLCDHNVTLLGPLHATLIPLSAVGVACTLSWIRWTER